MRNIEAAAGEYYHIYNRGINKQDVFLDPQDYYRFLFLILHFQSPKIFFNMPGSVKQFVQQKKLIDQDEIATNRFVELIAFCLMPNHFHLIVKEHQEGGIARYLHKVQSAYSKYYNARYQKSGHLFQGPYKIVYVEDNEQLLYLSAYVHQNPRDLSGWKNKTENYYWSSYQDFCDHNRFDKLLVPGIILDQFNSQDEYRQSVEDSGAKDRNEFDDYQSILIDNDG